MDGESCCWEGDCWSERVSREGGIVESSGGERECLWEGVVREGVEGERGVREERLWGESKKRKGERREGEGVGVGMGMMWEGG